MNPEQFSNLSHARTTAIRMGQRNVPQTDIHRTLWHYGDWQIHQQDREDYVIDFFSWDGRHFMHRSTSAERCVRSVLIEIYDLLWREINPTNMAYRWNA